MAPFGWNLTETATSAAKRTVPSGWMRQPSRRTRADAAVVELAAHAVDGEAGRLGERRARRRRACAPGRRSRCRRARAAARGWRSRRSPPGARAGGSPPSGRRSASAGGAGSSRRTTRGSSGSPKRTMARRNGRGTRAPIGWIWSVPTRPTGTIGAPGHQRQLGDTGVAVVQQAVARARALRVDAEHVAALEHAGGDLERGHRLARLLALDRDQPHRREQPARRPRLHVLGLADEERPPGDRLQEGDGVEERDVVGGDDHAARRAARGRGARR